MVLYGTLCMFSYQTAVNFLIQNRLNFGFKFTLLHILLFFCLDFCSLLQCPMKRNLSSECIIDIHLFVSFDVMYDISLSDNKVYL